MPSQADRELETLIRARYPIIYIVSWEEKRVEDALRTITANRGKRMFVWTVTQGMVTSPTATDNATRQPMAALDFILNSNDPAVFVLKDFHSFLNDFELVRRLRALTYALKTSYQTLVLPSPPLTLPPEPQTSPPPVDYSLPPQADRARL